jgi:hypothetical protein
LVESALTRAGVPLFSLKKMALGVSGRLSKALKVALVMRCA